MPVGLDSVHAVVKHTSSSHGPTKGTEILIQIFKSILTFYLKEILLNHRPKDAH